MGPLTVKIYIYCSADLMQERVLERLRCPLEQFQNVNLSNVPVYVYEFQVNS